MWCDGSELKACGEANKLLAVLFQVCILVICRKLLDYSFFTDQKMMSKFESMQTAEIYQIAFLVRHNDHSPVLLLVLINVICAYSK